MNKSLLLNNFLLALIWVIATRSRLRRNFIFGFMIGLGILWVTTAKTSDRKYFTIIPKLGYFILYIIWKIIVSNISTLKESLYSKSRLEPAIVKVPLTLTDDFHIATFANLVSLTPGTMVIDVSDDKKVMYVHVMHLENKEKFIRDVKEDFESKLIRIIRMNLENYFYWVIVPILAVSVILVFIRFLKGPSVADRVIALDMLFLVSICIIAIFSMAFNQSTFLDIALLFGLIAFFSTTVYAYYIEQKEKKMKEIVIMVLATAGALFILSTSVAMLRQPDVYLRISVTAKASTLGVGLILLAAAIFFEEFSVVSRILAIILFIFLTVTIGGHMLAQAAYFTKIPVWKGTKIDELAGKYDPETHELYSELPKEVSKNPTQKAMKKLNRLVLIGTVVVIAVLSGCDNKPQEEKVETAYSFLVGTYTENESQGIGQLMFDPEKNLLGISVIAPGANNPSFVISNKAQTLVFAVEETAGEKGGKVKSFRFDRQNNKLEPIDAQDTYGDHPCYLALDATEEFLVVGNYSGGNFSTFKVNDGKLTHVQTIQHEGQSINTDRQEKPHVHSTVFHPDGKHLLVGDLGTDKIHIYRFNSSYAVPFNHANPAYFEVEPGSGPRHLAIHPNGTRIYLVHELTAAIGVYSFDNGRIDYIESFPLTANDFIGNVSAAEVRISPDAKHVYVSNRGDANEISVFKILENGNLEWVERVKTGGEMPRNFILTKDGKYLLAAHQASNNITVFERNTQTGKLTKLALETKINKPVYFSGWIEENENLVQRSQADH